MRDRLAALLLALLLFVPAGVFAAEQERPEADDPFQVKEVIVVSNGRRTNGPVYAGDVVDVVVIFQSRFLKTEDPKAKDDIVVKRREDSFEGSDTAELNRLSKPGEALVFEAVFKKLTYKGVATDLNYKLETKLPAPDRQERTLKIGAFVPGPKPTEPTPVPTEPTPEPTPVPTEPTPVPTEPTPVPTEPTEPTEPSEPSEPRPSESNTPEPQPEPSESNLGESVEPQPTPQPTAEPKPAPTAAISRVDSEVPSAGKESELVLRLTNEGDTPLVNPILRLSAGAGLVLAEDSQSKLLPDIAPGSQYDVHVRVSVPEATAATKAVLTADLSFQYDDNGTLRQGGLSRLIDVALRPASIETKKPLLVLSRDSAAGDIAPGGEQTVQLKLQNVGEGRAEAIEVNVTADDSLEVEANQKMISLGALAASETAELALRVRAKKEAAGTADLRLTVTYRGEEEQSEAEPLSETITLTIAKSGDDGGLPSGGGYDSSWGGSSYSGGLSTPQIDSAVPNVIVDRYDYGGKPVEAGEAFDLKVSFFNTSEKLNVENIVLSLEPGENFVFDSTSNMYYVAAMKAGERREQTMRLRALTSAKTGSQVIEVTFKYEYVDNDKRSTGTITQKLSIPIFQPDRFQVTRPEVPSSATAGEEVTLTLNYVNKGKGDVFNVEALLNGDVEAVTKVQNVGNVEAGKSGQIVFLLRPETPGRQNVEIVVNYEDVNQKMTSQTFDVELNVEETAFNEEELPQFTVTPPEEEPFNYPLWVGAPAAGVAMLATGIVLKKRRRSKDDYLAVEWEDEITPDPGSDS